MQAVMEGAQIKRVISNNPESINHIGSQQMQKRDKLQKMLPQLRTWGTSTKKKKKSVKIPSYSIVKKQTRK
jgi:hypothetical protein